MDKQDCVAATMALWREIASQAGDMDTMVAYRVGKREEGSMSVMTLAHKIDTGALSDQTQIQQDETYVPAQEYFAALLTRMQARAASLGVMMAEEPEPVKDTTIQIQADEAPQGQTDAQTQAEIPQAAAQVAVPPVKMKKTMLISGAIALGTVLLIIISSIINDVMQLAVKQPYARKAPLELSPEAWGTIAMLVGIGAVAWLIFNGLVYLCARMIAKKRARAQMEE